MLPGLCTHTWGRRGYRQHLRRPAPHTATAAKPAPDIARVHLYGASTPVQRGLLLVHLYGEVLCMHTCTVRSRACTPVQWGLVRAHLYSEVYMYSASTPVWRGLRAQDIARVHLYGAVYTHETLRMYTCTARSTRPALRKGRVQSSGTRSALSCAALASYKWP